MKFSKINETQIRFWVSRADLEERDIDIAKLADDLTNGSVKTRLLVEDMKELLAENNVQLDNAPLMMEIVSVEPECVIINITRIDVSEIVQKLDTLAMMGLVAGMKTSIRMTCKKLHTPVGDAKKENVSDNGLLIFSFDTIDRAAEAICAVDVHLRHYRGVSRLYKHDGKYFLYLHSDEYGEQKNLAKIHAMLHEFGQKCAPQTLSVNFMHEHAEIIIHENAIHKLIAYQKA